jgi:hypothetical protein
MRVSLPFAQNHGVVLVTRRLKFVDRCWMLYRTDMNISAEVLTIHTASERNF